MTTLSSAPKYALIERERRWLVNSARRPSLEGLPFTIISDRYIHGSRLRLRRVEDESTGRITFKLTRKYESDDPIARPIVTAYINEAEFQLLSGLEAHCIAKRRYKVAGFSLDVFEGVLSGLELVEIEAKDSGALLATAPLDWFDREVSHDPDFEGARLARLPHWRV